MLSSFRTFSAIWVLIVLYGLTGCQKRVVYQQDGSGEGGKVAVISVTSDPEADLQSVNMALTFARFCVDEGYQVAIFFNVKGVTVPTERTGDDLAYAEHDPLKEQLASLDDDGVEIHVCPVCMGDLDVDESELMEGAFVTTKPKLFANLGPSTMVFTY